MSAAAILVVATTVAIALAANVIGSHMLEREVDRRFTTIAHAAAGEISGLIGTAVSTLREQRVEAAQSLLPLDDGIALGRQFGERLRQQQQLAWLSYGDAARDRFVGATRRPDGSILINRSEPHVNGGVPVETEIGAD